jgi:hypothetical protein
MLILNTTQRKIRYYGKNVLDADNTLIFQSKTEHFKLSVTLPPDEHLKFNEYHPRNHQYQK